MKRGLAEQLIDIFCHDMAGYDVEMILFGGMVIALHLDDLPEGELARETNDVDCGLGMRPGFGPMPLFEAQLHQDGWTPLSDAVTETRPRNLYAKKSPSGIPVDFIPMQAYGDADALNVCKADVVLHRLPSGKTVQILSPAASLVTKLAAHWDRGTQDLYDSHDLEDVALLLCGCSMLEAAIHTATPALKALLASLLQQTIDDADTRAALITHMPRAADVTSVMNRLYTLIELTNSRR